MAANVYEGMFILDSNRYSRDPEAASSQVQQLIEKAGGEILVSRLWEERRLAYPIKGQRRGTYWLTYFRLDSPQLASIRRQCELNENFLRVLLLRLDPRIVDALVAHALSAQAGGPAATADTATADTATADTGIDPDPDQTVAVGLADDENLEDEDN